MMAAGSILSGLTDRQRSAYPIIRRGVIEGLTQSRIEQALRKEGLGIRHDIMRAIIRHERVVQAYSSLLRNLPPSAKPTARELPEALTTLTRRYAFTYDVKGVMLSTGKPIVHHITLSQDKLLTKETMDQLARDLVGGRRDRYGTEVEEVTLTSGLRAGPEGTL